MGVDDSANTASAIPKEVAARLCAEIRRKNRGKWYSFNAWWCWGCVTFTGGGEKMCFYSPPDYRGCAQVNARYDRERQVGVEGE